MRCSGRHGGGGHRWSRGPSGRLGTRGDRGISGHGRVRGTGRCRRCDRRFRGGGRYWSGRWRRGCWRFGRCFRLHRLPCPHGDGRVSVGSWGRRGGCRRNGRWGVLGRLGTRRHDHQQDGERDQDQERFQHSGIVSYVAHGSSLCPLHPLRGRIPAAFSHGGYWYGHGRSGLYPAWLIQLPDSGRVPQIQRRRIRTSRPAERAGGGRTPAQPRHQVSAGHHHR